MSASVAPCSTLQMHSNASLTIATEHCSPKLRRRGAETN